MNYSSYQSNYLSGLIMPEENQEEGSISHLAESEKEENGLC